MTNLADATICPVIDRWMTRMQDAMPAEMCGSEEWRRLVPLVAGTRDPGREQARADMILDWMWTVVLPHHQPRADAGGYGAEWRAMCEQRTQSAAVAAAEAARAAADAAEAAARAAEAARAAARAAWAGAWAAEAARAAAWASAEAAAWAAAETAAWASAEAAAWAAAETAPWEAEAAAAWAHFAPVDLLQRLIDAWRMGCARGERDKQMSETGPKAGRARPDGRSGMSRPHIIDFLRAEAAAELHALDSWSARVDRVIALAEEYGAQVEDAGRYLKLRLLGQTATAKAPGLPIYAAWAETVMREFPATAEARP